MAAGIVARTPRLAARVGGSRLLVFPIILLAVGLVLLALARHQPVEWETLTGAGLFAAGVLAAATWVRVRLPASDPLLLPLSACLAALGQVMTSRLEPAL